MAERWMSPGGHEDIEAETGASMGTRYPMPVDLSRPAPRFVAESVKFPPSLGTWVPIEWFEALAARVKEIAAERDQAFSRVTTAETHNLDHEERANRLIMQLQEERALLGAVVAPLLPLFREWRAAFEKYNSPAAVAAFGGEVEPLPETITLAAKFPTAALLALAKEKE